MVAFGPGTLKIGETATEIDVSCLVNSAVLSADSNTADPTTKLCGTQVLGATTYTCTLSGNMDIDPDDPDGIFCLSWSMPGEELPFEFIPNTADGTSATGTLTLTPLDFGNADDYGSDMTADFEFQVAWKPDVICGGGGAMATGATAGTPGTWTPGGSTPPATLAALTGGSVTASPTTAWTTGQYVALGDASYAHWNGTAWVTAAAP
jgi:hypothetical protein